MLDISRAGVGRTNTVACLENSTSGRDTDSIDSNNHNTTITTRTINSLSTNRTNSTDELKEYAHKLCRDYLRGAWITTHFNDMIFKRVSGGLSNLLYFCALPDSVQTTGREPRRLLLRLYGNVNSEKAIENLITESVIFTLLSETQRGPRLYGVFSGGRLEEYIEARALKTTELSNPTISALIADKMAQIHAMDVPLIKQPIWLWQTINGWIDQLEKLMATGTITESSKDMMKSVQSLQLSKEYAWLKKYLISFKSPVVFCHNDLQEGNILLRNGSLTDNRNNNNNYNSNRKTISSDIPFKPPNKNKAGTNLSLDTEVINENNDYTTMTTTSATATTTASASEDNQLTNDLTSDDLVIIDFEYCSYNYRAFDFANHFCEWIYDYSNQSAPYFWCIESNKPTHERKAHFINSYLKSLAAHPEYKKHEEDSFERILEETNAFMLASHFFWGLWSVINVTTSEIAFDYWSYGKCRFAAYYAHKKRLIEQSKE